MQHMLSSAMDLNIQNGQAECTVITRTFEIITKMFWTGFEPWTSDIAVLCSIDWAINIRAVYSAITIFNLRGKRAQFAKLPFEEGNI